MNKTLARGGIFLAMFLLLAACATTQPMAPFTPQDLDSQDYVAKPENFVVVFDGSSSMGETYRGQLNTGHSKFAVAKDLVDRMNRTIPDLETKGAVTAFGLDPDVAKNPTVTVYGLTDYSRDGLAEGMGRITSPGGTTPMGLGLAQAGELLKGAEDDLAIILFSDGKENTSTTPGALEAANALKDQFGDRLCLYTVYVGNTEAGRKMMNDLAATSACGSATSADELATADAMAAFVEEVFLEGAPAAPAPPPAPAPMPAPQPKISWILSGVNFDLDSAVVRPDAKDVLQSDIRILRDNPEIRVEVQGHTCDLGEADYNRDLSARRAQAIKDYLVSQGIAADRLTPRGYGEDRPRFPNDSEANRAKNRRVELVPIN